MDQTLKVDWRFGRNWFSWMDPYGIYSGNGLGQKASPYMHERVWIMREGWEEPREVVVREMSPLMNVADLYWTTDPPVRHS